MNGTWIQTSSGGKFYYDSDDTDCINIEDIAHALSNPCRFGGHSGRFYSVAQHSVVVAYLVEKELMLTALLHDASEAYVVDVPRPLKRILPSISRLIVASIDRLSPGLTVTRTRSIRKNAVGRVENWSSDTEGERLRKISIS